LGSGFLSGRRQGSHNLCENPMLTALCEVMRTNPTTENIAVSLQALYETFLPVAASTFTSVDQDSDYMHRFPADIAEAEIVFDWLTMASCRVGYNHNPTGSNGQSPIVIPKQLAVPLLEYAKYFGREPAVSPR
jgi:hypothetical protein